MHSQKYTLDDLILDPAFIKWVKSPDKTDGSKWVEWSVRSADNASILSEARDIILELSTDADEPLQQELNELWSRIEASNDAWDLTQNNKSIFRRLIHSWYKIAAVSAGILLISFLAKIYLDNRNGDQHTAFGEQKTIILPDSSVVILNANSTVSYSNNWNETKPREVYLKGEAFFSVVHKKNSQRFIVHTKDLDVQVLGTKFNVNTRHSQTKVFLKSGKVKLFLTQATKKVVEMRPGDMVNFSPVQNVLLKKVVKPEVYTSWVDKKLAFEGASLKEIAQVLQDNYGYQVVFANSELASLTFTGTVDSGKIDLLLNILQKTFDISIEKKEGVLIVSKK